MRAVLDTNVIVSAALIRGGNEDRIIRALERGAFELIFSPAILEEIGHVLSYEKIKKYRWITDEEVILLIESFAEKSTIVSGKVKVGISRDPNDDKFLVAAFEGKADYLVTGDRDLLVLKSFKGTQIIKPAAFLKLLE